MDDLLLAQPGRLDREAPPADNLAAGYGEAGRLPAVPTQPGGSSFVDDELALDSPWPTVNGWWMLGSDGD